MQINHLHEKQAERIFQIHKYMCELYSSLKDYTTEFQARTNNEMKGKRENVSELLSKTGEYHDLNSLYLSSELSLNIKNILDEIKTTAISFMTEIEMNNGSDISKNWDEIHKKVEDKIKSAISGLANEFRIILGVN
ncbi:hypothetical protein D5R81_17685 [Parashewanella spongiae]|uniref:Uncharacterized protein n=1 Tax=Parashewanella spongiae TaxID=342950 RepID=A0A3A6THS7_9GAMM|nr:hypothetical protein [Parashewanella spongiae]MCL1079879.1 hypothetical protein [Parashewanella spongiae]RJY06475.1 hypothetical protein D5R81_17685 [Parashewanella spongiae]